MFSRIEARSIFGFRKVCDCYIAHLAPVFFFAVSSCPFVPHPHKLKCRFAHVLLQCLRKKNRKESTRDEKKKNNQVPRLQKVQCNTKSYPQSHIYTSPVTKCWAQQCTNISGTSNLSVHIQGHPNSSTSYHSLMSSWSDNGQNEWETKLHHSR